MNLSEQQVSNDVLCSQCRSYLYGSIHALCSFEQGTGFIRFCIGCLANTIEPIKKYRIINAVNVNLPHQYLNKTQLYLLSFALEQFGYCNWDQICQFINEQMSFTPNSNTIDILTLIKFFQQGFQTLSKNKKQLSWLQEELSCSFFQMGENKQIVERRPKLSPSPMTPLKQFYSKIGYNPYRKEFDIDFNQEAELMLSELQINSEDKQEQIEDKYLLLQGYNRKLNEREYRKNLVINHWFPRLQRFFQGELMKNSDESYTKRKIQDRIRLLIHNYQAENFQKLIDGIQRIYKINCKLTVLRKMQASKKQQKLNTFQNPQSIETLIDSKVILYLENNFCIRKNLKKQEYLQLRCGLLRRLRQQKLLQIKQLPEKFTKLLPYAQEIFNLCQLSGYFKSESY